MERFNYSKIDCSGHSKYYRLMRKLLFISLLAMSLLSLSCNNGISKNDAVNKLQKVLQIDSISSQVKIVDYETSFSTTSDYTESFGIQFQKNEFDRIFQKIKPKQVSGDATLYYFEKHSEHKHYSITFEPGTLTIYYNYDYE